MKLRALAFASAVFAASGAGTALHLGQSDDPTRRGAEAAPVVMASMHEFYGSSTPEEWNTNSDHIATVTVVGERMGVRDSATAQRIASIQVEDIHASRRGAPGLPDNFDMPVLGWSFTSTGERAPFAVRGASRMMPGHTYLVGLIHLPPRCNPDDGLYPGGWSMIGTSGVIPMDGGELGSGEVEGQEDAVLEAPFADTVARTVRQNQSLDSVIAAIESAPKGTRERLPGDRIGC